VGGGGIAWENGFWDRPLFHKTKEGKMKSLKKIKWSVGAILLGTFLFAPAGTSFTKEISLSEQARMASQGEMGGALMNAGSLSWRYGQVEEQLGRLIRDAGPGESLDQPRLGKLIAEAAHIKWHQSVVQSSLGASIAKDAILVFNDDSIGRSNQDDVG
jgi:hypothetical protein